jgi:1,4-alpha-glucan branching enzyme
MIFMGQEFLEYRSFPNYNGYPDLIDRSRKDTYNGNWTLYRGIIRLRRNWNNNTRGLRGRKVHVLAVFGDNMLVFHRWDQGGGGDDVTVLCNFANQRYANYQIGKPCPGIWRIRFNSDSRDYDAYFDNGPSFDTDANGPALNGMPNSANIGVVLTRVSYSGRIELHSGYGFVAGERI